MKSIKVRIRFVAPILGSMPMNEEIYRDYIASKAPAEQDTEDEIQAITVDDAVVKGKTTFPRNDEGYPFIFDYHVKGFFKESCGYLRTLSGTKSRSLKSYKRNIDGLVFVNPREIYFENVKSIFECQRPLRASTPLGERTALAISDAIQEGAELEFVVDCFNEDYEELVKEWLNYGIYKGMGQWRNSGKGRFEVVSYEVSDKAGFWE